MRYRYRTRIIPGLSGDFYSWLVSWHQTQSYNESSVSIPVWIYDDLGRTRVNPLHAFNVEIDRPVTHIDANDGFFRYIGGVAVDTQLLGYRYDELAGVHDLNAWATKGQARSRDIRPYFDIAQNIAELRDAHMLVRNVDELFKFVKKTYTERQGLKVIRDLLRQVGDQTLAVTFGVFPLIEVIDQLFDLTIETNKRIKRLRRLDGKWQHKRVDLLDQRTSWSADLVEPIKPLRLFQTVTIGNEGVQQFERRDHIWYETDVKFQIPTMRTMSKDEWLRIRVQGRQITPRLLWELSPFSWLIDWFIDVGSFYANMDDLTVYTWRNACVMHETTSSSVVNATLTYKSAQGDRTLPVTGSSRAKIMRRHAHRFNRVGVASSGLDSLYRQVVTGALLLKSL